MSHSSKTTSVTPFYPRPFPPKRVNQRKYASLLKQANLALKAYKTILENTSCPETLFAHFATLEAIDSLESQESSIALAEFLLTPKKHDSVVQIHNYLDALKTASRATSVF